MKCYKCGKEMDRENSLATIKGIEIEIDVAMRLEPVLPGDIEYYNQQLGKYSDGQGRCHIGICYECYIDGLFNMAGGGK